MAGLVKCLEHQADLSVFAQAEELLFVCEQRHWWIVLASDTGTTNKAAAKRVLEGVVPARMSAADSSMKHLRERFGEDVLGAMSLR